MLPTSIKMVRIRDKERSSSSNLQAHATTHRAGHASCGRSKKTPTRKRSQTMNDPRDTPEQCGPRPSPHTDPTAPHHQGDFGWPGPNERATERAQDEPGLTEHDRDERDAGKSVP